MPHRPKSQPWMRRFAAYLRPHKLRIAVGIFSMVMVGFFGAFNFILLKPALEVILGAEQPESSVTVVRQLDDGTTETLTVDNVVAVVDQQAPQESAKEEALLKVGFLRKARDKWNQLVSPVVERAKAWNDRLQAKGRQNPTQALMVIAGLIVVMALFHAFFDFMAQYHMAYSLLDLMRRLKDDIFKKVISQDFLYFVRQSTGYLESRINSDVAMIRQMIDALLTDAIQMPLRLVFLFIVLLLLNFQLTLIAVVVLPVAAVPLVIFARAIRKITRRAKRKADQLSATMEEALRNFKVIKCFMSEDYETERFVRRNLRLFEYNLKRRIARFGASPIMEVLGAIGGSAVLILGGSLILRQRMEFSTLMVYLAALTQFYTPLRRISKLNSVLQSGRVSAERILEMLDLKTDLTQAPDPRPLEKVRQGIAFRDVTFIYDDQPVLRDLNFEVPVGRTIAIVGRSGSGKTTLASLIMRLFDSTSGSVEIDGHKYRLKGSLDAGRCRGCAFNEPPIGVPVDGFCLAAGMPEPDSTFLMTLCGNAGIDRIWERYDD